MSKRLRWPWVRRSTYDATVSGWEAVATARKRHADRLQDDNDLLLAQATDAVATCMDLESIAARLRQRAIDNSTTFDSTFASLKKQSVDLEVDALGQCMVVPWWAVDSFTREIHSHFEEP